MKYLEIVNNIINLEMILEKQFRKGLNYLELQEKYKFEDEIRIATEEKAYFEYSSDCDSSYYKVNLIGHILQNIVGTKIGNEYCTNDVWKCTR